MRDEEQEEKAVLDLRARGLSYREIAARLGTTEEKILNLTDKLQENVRKGGCNC
jgi:transcriptional regulator